MSEPADAVGASPAPDGLRVLPVAGLPEFRPGDDLADAIAAAAPWISDGDVLVVTSKVLSKTEGRLVPAPTDPEQRDAFRRELVDSETVRLVAQMGRTKIVENHLGLIAAAAGIDASNVHGDEIALLPVDPDASAAALVAAFADRGIRVGVVITDTQGRAWRTGVTDVAIGAAGVAVLDDHRGGIDEHGNQLVVTQVAIGDEMAAAADLVKGKLSAVPVAVLRGLNASSPEYAGAGPAGGGPAGGGLEGGGLEGGGHSLIRPFEQDLFRLGTDLALAEGRRDGALLAARELEFDHTEPIDAAEVDRLVAEARELLPQRIGTGLEIGALRDSGGAVVIVAGGAAPDNPDLPPPAVRAGAGLQIVRSLLAARGYTSRWLPRPPDAAAGFSGDVAGFSGAQPMAGIALGRRRREDEPTNRLAGPAPRPSDFPRP